jgi:hypothetical protein
MPRSAPTQVIEHRISLQDAERAAVLPILNDVRQFTQAANTTRQVATLGALGLAGAALWYLPQIYVRLTAEVNGLIDDGKKVFDDLSNPLGAVADAVAPIADVGDFLDRAAEGTAEKTENIVDFFFGIPGGIVDFVRNPPKQPGFGGA